MTNKKPDLRTSFTRAAHRANRLLTGALLLSPLLAAGAVFHSAVYPDNSDRSLFGYMGREVRINILQQRTNQFLREHIEMREEQRRRGELPQGRLDTHGFLDYRA